MKVIDILPFFNELDLLELRLEFLYHQVDYFIITECDFTFSGQKKDLFFLKNQKRYHRFRDKIIHNCVDRPLLDRYPYDKRWIHYVTDLDAVYQHKHNGRPARGIHPTLKREILQRDSGIIALSQVAEADDLVVLSDVDEIYHPDALNVVKSKIKTGDAYYFEMEWYLYWLNNIIIDQSWYGSVAFLYKDLNGKSLDIMRYASSDVTNIPGSVLSNGGWHFSYMGGAAKVAEKIKAMPFQGFRAEIMKILNRMNIYTFENVISRNNDLMLQKRKSFIRSAAEMDLIGDYINSPYLRKYIKPNVY